MQAQLNITDYYVNSIAVQINDQFKQKEKVTGKVNVDFDIKQSTENPLNFMISMLIELNNSDDDFTLSEYRIILNIVGIYSFAEGTDEATINNMIAPSGLSILYGMARGVVSQVTGNCKYGKFILPTLNFMEIIKHKFKKLADTEISAPARKSPLKKRR